MKRNNSSPTHMWWPWCFANVNSCHYEQNNDTHHQPKTFFPVHDTFRILLQTSPPVSLLFTVSTFAQSVRLTALHGRYQTKNLHLCLWKNYLIGWFLGRMSSSPLQSIRPNVPPVLEIIFSETIKPDYICKKRIYWFFCNVNFDQTTANRRHSVKRKKKKTR